MHSDGEDNADVVRPLAATPSSDVQDKYHAD